MRNLLRQDHEQRKQAQFIARLQFFLGARRNKLRNYDRYTHSSRAEH